MSGALRAPDVGLVDEILLADNDLNPRPILAKGHIFHPMQTVFDTLMSPNRLIKRLRMRC